MRFAPKLFGMSAMAVMAVVVAGGLISSAEAARDPLSARPDPVQLSTSDLDEADAARVTLTNEMSRAIQIDILPEPPESAFSYRDSACSERLQPHASCQITVRFRPERWGLTTGRLIYAFGNARYAVNLRGTARRPGNDNESVSLSVPRR